MQRKCSGSLIFALATLVSAIGCGGDETSTSASGSGGSSSASTGSTSASSSGASSTTGAGGGPVFTAMNGCDPETAENFEDAAIEIQFPVNGNRYSPACVVIHATHSVNFMAVNGSNFVSHPLVGGVVEGGVATPDANSPLGKVDMGDNTAVYFQEPGQFGFYCDYHYPENMMGTVYVKVPPP